MEEDESRQENKRKMAILIFWMFLIGWCIALHYFAWIGLMASIERV